MRESNRPPKTAMLLARRILRDAIRRGLRPGDMLPSEREMLDVYATGRGTLRESLRLLEFEGVITIKPGFGGGPMLHDPDATPLTAALVVLLQLKRAPFRTVVEARSAIEPVISALAARRISAEALAELKDSIALMEGSVDSEHVFLDANKQFHDIIARSSGNPLFGYIIESVLGIMDGVSAGIRYPLHRRAAILEAHQGILEALAARDADAAEELMRKHILEFERYAEWRFPAVMDGEIQWGR